MEYYHGWVAVWAHGGIGNFHYTRYAVMEEMVTEGYWAEAVEASGFIRNDIFYEMLETAEFNDLLKKKIHKPEIVRKVWRRIKRREGFNLVRATRIIRADWLEVS